MSKHSKHRTLAENKSEAAVDREAVEAMAYQLWLLRGSPIGSDHEDWYRAEAELKGKEESGQQKGTANRPRASITKLFQRTTS